MAFSLKPILLLFFCSAVLAQGTVMTINDPTRPPASFVGTVDAGVAAASPGGRLRSVKIARTGGRSSAVIDGQVLRLGEKLGDARLIHLTENEAVLESAAGKETLYLTPDVIKKPTPAKAVRTRKKETP